MLVGHYDQTKVAVSLSQKNALAYFSTAVTLLVKTLDH
jgi:hypothetical protein